MQALVVPPLHSLRRLAEAAPERASLGALLDASLDDQGEDASLSAAGSLEAAAEGEW